MVLFRSAFIKQDAVFDWAFYGIKAALYFLHIFILIIDQMTMCM